MQIPRVAALGLVLALTACQDAATAPDAAMISGTASATVIETGVAEPVANRVAAITHLVLTTNDRIGAVIRELPPNPCTELDQACSAAFGALIAYAALGQGVADVCAGGLPAGAALTPGGEGTLAATTSATAVGGQLMGVANALGNATNRFASMFALNPGPPNAPTAAALDALSQAVFTGGSALAGWLGGAFDYPPNPCGAR